MEDIDAAEYQSDDYHNNYNGNVDNTIMQLREYIEELSTEFKQLKLDTQNKLEIQVKNLFIP